MKILLLPAYYNPEQIASSHLTDNLYEAFANEGFEMELHCPTPSRGISSDLRAKLKKIKYEEQLGGKLKIHRFPMFREGKNPIMRALRFFFCHCVQIFKGIGAKNIDLILVASTPPTQGAMVAILKKIKKVPVIYNLQDIFPDSLVGTGLTHRKSVLWKIGRTIEDFTYRNADEIIVISKDFKSNIMGKGVPEKKITVIYNWIDENKLVNVERKDNTLFEKYNLNKKKFYVSYCGNIGLTQNMDLLLDVAKELETIPDLHFVLIGEGAYKKNVEEIIAVKEINNITLLPFQPYQDISQVYSLGDVGLVISKPGVGKNSVPSKTWSIMSVGRPIIASFDENELKQIIRNNNCGIFTKAGDKEELKAAIYKLYKNLFLCNELGRNGRSFILKNLTRSSGTSKYINVIKSINGL